MHNSDQVRDFFRKMADGLVLQANSQNEDRSNCGRDDRRSQEKPAERVRTFSDFGVGLPPMAHS